MAATPHNPEATTASPLDRHAPPVSDHRTATGTKSGMATASMVLGIIALPALLFWPLALILGIVGLTLGLVARGQIKRSGMQGAGQAMAGIICSALALALIVVLFVIIGIAVNNS